MPTVTTINKDDRCATCVFYCTQVDEGVVGFGSTIMEYCLGYGPIHRGWFPFTSKEMTCPKHQLARLQHGPEQTTDASEGEGPVPDVRER